MKKLKYTKKADIFAKCCCVCGFVFGLLFIVASMFLGGGDNKPHFITIICLVLSIVSGIIIIIYPYIFEEGAEDFGPKIKPDKIPINFSSFSDFFKDAEKSLENFGLIKIASQEHENYKQHLYSTQRKFKNMDFVLILTADEITWEILNLSSDEFTECIESYFRKDLNRIALNVNIITIVCTKRVTHSLRNILNKNGGTEQSFGIGRFFSAISFGGKNLYLIKQKGLVGKGKYKKCKKKFFKYFHFLLPQQNDK